MLEKLKRWWASLFEDGLNHDWDGEWTPMTDEERAQMEEDLRENEERLYKGQYEKYFR